MIVISPSDAIPWSTSVKTRSDSAQWCPHFPGTPHLEIRWVTVIYPVTWGGVVRPATTGHCINAANSTFAWNCSCTCIYQHVPSCLQSGAGETESVVCGCNTNNGDVQGRVWRGEVTHKSGDYASLGSAEWLHCRSIFLTHPLVLNSLLSIYTS